MAQLFEIVSLSAAYNGNIVLDEISLKVNEHDFVGIIGPNGGGKTTLLKVILGLVKPLKGSVNFNSEFFGSRAIGYLPQLQTGDLTYPVNVQDVLLSGLMIRKGIFSSVTKADRRKALDIIEELGLVHLAGSHMNELSGGELQRVFLGRAIIGDPQLLLLDEPGNFVDTNFESDFYDKLRELNNRMAILMVSHDIGTVSAYVKSYACVNRTLHYHPSSEITNEQLLAYGCPIQLITHGDVPHTVLKYH